MCAAQPAFSRRNRVAFSVWSGAGRVAGGGADAAVALGDQVGVVQLFVGGIAPDLLPHELMQALGGGFGQPVRQRLDHDVGVVVTGMSGQRGLDADAGRHRKAADVVPLRGHEVR